MDRLHTSQDRESPRPAPARTLIPEHVVDQASQRMFVVSIFVAIQCWKIYDVLLVKADAFALANSGQAQTVVDTAFTSLNNFTFVLKYIVVDGLFLWMLPILNIPFLTFSPIVTVLLTCLVNALTLALTSTTALPLLSSVFVPIWNYIHKSREMTIVGDSATPSSVIDMSAHFKGKYTIQFLPESSAHFNPFKLENTCLESPESGSSTFPSSINLPIEFNTTSDIGYMQLEHTAPDNAVTLLNYTKYDIRRLLKRDYSKYSKHSADERVFFMEVELKKPGKYKLHKVVDVDGMSIRSYKSDFTVGYCPSAKFVYPGLESAYSGYKCVMGNSDDVHMTVPLISAFGVLPLAVEMATFDNGKKLSSFKTNITDQIKNGNPLAWLESHSISRNALEQELLREPQHLKIKGTQNLEFHIVSITDRLGNTRRYNPESKHEDVHYAIQLRKAPILQLTDVNPNKKLVMSSSKKLQLTSKNDVVFPLSVEVEFTPENSSTAEVLSLNFKTKEDFQKGLEISEPGVYKLRSGQDSYCPCTIDSTQSLIEVWRPLPPSVKISETPILDKCVGTLGFDFKVLFKGASPFQINYEIYKNTSGILRPVLTDRGFKVHTKRASSNELSFQYKPQHEGNYVLKFKSISDANYGEDFVSLPEGEFTYSTYLNKRSRFTFFKNEHRVSKTLNLCKNAMTSIPLHFEGNFPFSFRYEIVNTKSNKVVHSETIKNHFDDSFVVKTPKFSEGGEYKVVVRDVVDKMGCSAESNSQEVVKLQTRKDISEIEIQKSSVHHIVEGESVRIPITVRSEVGTSGADQIVIQKRDLRDSTKVKNITVYGKTDILVKEEGIYSLVSYSSSGCPGAVKHTANTVTVHHHPKPKLTVVPPQERVVEKPSNGPVVLQSVCQGEPHKLELKLEGKKPFIVNYNIRYPHGKLKSNFLTVDSDHVTLPLPSNRAGVYQHSFVEVYDSLYTKERMASIDFKPPVQSITYNVKAAPELEVEKKYLQVCESTITENVNLELSLKFKGAAPFDLKGRIINKVTKNSDSFEINGVDGSKINLNKLKTSRALDKIFTVGEHIITFDGISDSNSCESSKLVDENTVTLFVTKVPSISKSSGKKYYCVGDHVAYNMSGISPFVVFYSFNGQQRKAESDYEFSRLASKPGELTIEAVQDSSASSCLVNYTKKGEEFDKLKLQVHDLPSVEISHGDSIIKNLNEGDQSEITFKFIGTPPFSVTYVRTLGQDEGQHKRRKGHKAPKGTRRVVDTKTVDNIWDYEHTEVVGLEGTYEAIEVTDAYCSAKRDVKEVL